MLKFIKNMIPDVCSQTAVPKQLRSAPWTEATTKCNDQKRPAGGRTATVNMRAVFLVYCSLDNETYYTG